jgi:histidine triad (HIT) family protein
MHHGIAVPRNDVCSFCAFLRGDRPYTILERDSVVATLVTREQRGVPHLLVIPVRHCPTILDLADAEGAALIAAVRRVAAAIDRAYQRPGIAVWQNNGVPAHQSVAHVHFHVAGTLDGGGTNWGEVERLSVDETQEIASRLAPYLGAEATPGLAAGVSPTVPVADPR